MVEWSNAGRGLFGRSSAVASGPEFRRIRDLPRRDWDPPLAERLTALLKTTQGSQKLRPIQAQALYDIGTHGRLFGPIGVGEGKTLISMLAPRVLESKRPLLLLPAALIEKTKREQQLLMKHWRVSVHLRLFSYEMLGRVNASRYLEVYKPDLIISDECHKLKNKRAGVTRRVDRYMRTHPDTKVIAMSGTVMGNSLKDFAHVLEWTHKNDAPIPLEDEILEEWSTALDEKVNPLSRREAGALLTLDGATGTGDELERARRGFRSRLVSTPGVVASKGESGYTGSLYINALEYDVNAATEANFKKLREEWKTPDGWALSEAVAVWRHARELAIGLHYIWDPRPPDEWLLARKAWAGFVRNYLSRSRKLDTELQVARAVDAGEIDDAGLLGCWRAIKPTFEVNAKPVWHDDSALKECGKWLSYHDKGICWVEHVFFAKELERRTGLPYFGSQGVDENLRPIESANGPIIASIAANGTGRNLQAWDSNLITAIPGSSAMEQLLGRTHRTGQSADTVSVDVLFGCIEHKEALDRAVAVAHMQEDVIGQTQKLLLADLSYPLVLNKPGFRWLKTSDLKV